MSVVIGILVLAADIWAILNIFQSRADNGKKVLWTVLVLIFPVAGLILWFFVGPRERGKPPAG
jgi:hypothetical protein